MATYMYKAVTSKGVIVKNKVEAVSRIALIKSLKNNNLMPISIEQLSYNSKNKRKKQKKNVTDIQEIMKNVNTTQIGREKKQHLYTSLNLWSYVAAGIVQK